MIRRLCVPISSCADFIRPIALALFTSAVFTWTTISSISAAPLGKEQDRARIIAQIRSILSAQQDAWNRGDIDGFMNGYARSRSTIFVSEDAVRRGWETTPVSADVAVVLGRWKLKRAQDRPHGRFTLIFRKSADGWRIVHDHTSVAAP